MITPAMLEEEEQLEAAGLEKERKMLEEVMRRDRRRSPASPPPSPAVLHHSLGFALNFIAALVTCLSRTCKDETLAYALNEWLLSRKG